MIARIFSLFSHQVLEKLNLKNLNFWVLSDLAILEWFLTLILKHFFYVHIFKVVMRLMQKCCQSMYAEHLPLHVVSFCPQKHIYVHHKIIAIKLLHCSLIYNIIVL